MTAEYRQSTQELAKEWDKLNLSKSELIEQADQLRRKGDLSGAIGLYTRSMNHLKGDYERGLAKVGLGICCLLQEDSGDSNLKKAAENFASAVRNLRGRSPVEGIALLLLCLAQQGQGTAESLDEAIKTCIQAERALAGEALEEKARQRARELSAAIAEEPKGGEPSPFPPLNDLPPPEPAKLVRIPVLGEIAAGPLMLDEKYIEGYIPMGEEHARGIDFALRVKGDSMAGAGMRNGDTVFIRSQSHANKRDIVVAMVLGVMEEFALKRFYYDDNYIYLLSEPSEGQREVYLTVSKKEAAKVQIRGKVVTII